MQIAVIVDPKDRMKLPPTTGQFSDVSAVMMKIDTLPGGPIPIPRTSEEIAELARQLTVLLLTQGLERDADVPG